MINEQVKTDSKILYKAVNVASVNKFSKQFQPLLSPLFLKDFNVKTECRMAVLSGLISDKVIATAFSWNKAIIASNLPCGISC